MKPRLEIPEKHRVQLWQELGLDLGPDVHQILVRIGHTFRCRQSVLLDRHVTRQTDERIESKSRQKWEGVCVCVGELWKKICMPWFAWNHSRGSAAY